MRTFAVLLLLANLSYMGWNFYYPQKQNNLMVRAPSRQASRTLQLLSEVRPAPLSEQSELTEQKEPSSCISLGVFNNTDESDFLVTALLERGLQARAELLPTEETVNYRVYMPPFISDTAARQTLNELQQNNIESFIITTGEFSGGISLGLFSQQELALGLQESLAGQGFATSIEDIVTISNEIWVTIEGLSQVLLEGSELLDLLSGGLELEVIEKPCETFASRQ